MTTHRARRSWTGRTKPSALIATFAVGALLVVGGLVAFRSWANCELFECHPRPAPCSAEPLQVIGPSAVNPGDTVTVTTKGYLCHYPAVSGAEEIAVWDDPLSASARRYVSTSVPVSGSGAFTATLRLPTTVTSGLKFIYANGPTGYNCSQGSCAAYRVQITVRG